MHPEVTNEINTVELRSYLKIDYSAVMQVTLETLVITKFVMGFFSLFILVKPFYQNYICIYICYLFLLLQCQASQGCGMLNDKSVKTKMC